MTSSREPLQADPPMVLATGCATGSSPGRVGAVEAQVSAATHARPPLIMDPRHLALEETKVWLQLLRPWNKFLAQPAQVELVDISGSGNFPGFGAGLEGSLCVWETRGQGTWACSLAGLDLFSTRPAETTASLVNGTGLRPWKW